MLFHKQKQKKREKIPCDRDFILSVIVPRWVMFSASVWTPLSSSTDILLLGIFCILLFYYTTPVLFQKKIKGTEHICFINSANTFLNLCLSQEGMQI